MLHLFSGYGVAQYTDSGYLDFDDVAVLQVFRRVEAGAGAIGRAGRINMLPA